MNLFRQRIYISFLYFYIFKFQHEFHNFSKTKSKKEEKRKIRSLITGISTDLG